MKTPLLTVVLTCAGCATFAAGSVLTFDNLSAPGTVPSWYGPDLQGDWVWTDVYSNPWQVASGSTASAPNYVSNGLGPHYANTGEWWVAMGTAAGHGPYFNVEGASFAGLGSTSVKIEALRDGVVINTRTLALPANSFHWFDLNMNGLNYLRLSSDSPETHWAMDDLHYSAIPEPETGGAIMVFLAIACLGRKRESPEGFSGRR